MSGEWRGRGPGLAGLDDDTEKQFLGIFSFIQLVSTNTELGGDNGARFLLRSQRTQNIFADDY